MPFTGSHPAAILPLLRTRLPASALVIGSMAPDFPYYLPMPNSELTHTPVGVVTVDVLLGAAGWVLWHGLLSSPALAAAPAPVRGRLVGRTEPGLRRRTATSRQVALVLLALAVGAATHVLWDEFTHPWGWGPRHLAVLAHRWGPLDGSAWAQQASTVLGALLVVGWLARWWRRTTARPVAESPAARWVWPLLLAAGLATGVPAALRGATPGGIGFAGATWAGGTMLLAAVVLALGWHLRRASER